MFGTDIHEVPVDGKKRLYCQAGSLDSNLVVIPQSIEELILKRFVRFGHTWHSDELESTGSGKVHAKYCAGVFPHFLLPSGRQVHGWYNGTWRQLMDDMKKYEMQLVKAAKDLMLKDIPVFVTPDLRPIPEFVKPSLHPVVKYVPLETRKDLLRTTQQPPYITLTPLPEPPTQDVLLPVPPELERPGPFTNPRPLPAPTKPRRKAQPSLHMPPKPWLEQPEMPPYEPVLPDYATSFTPKLQELPVFTGLAKEKTPPEPLDDNPMPPFDLSEPPDPPTMKEPLVCDPPSYTAVSAAERALKEIEAQHPPDLVLDPEPPAPPKPEFREPIVTASGQWPPTDEDLNLPPLPTLRDVSAVVVQYQEPELEDENVPFVEPILLEIPEYSEPPPIPPEMTPVEVDVDLQEGNIKLKGSDFSVQAEMDTDLDGDSQGLTAGFLEDDLLNPLAEIQSALDEADTDGRNSEVATPPGSLPSSRPRSPAPSHPRSTPEHLSPAMSPVPSVTSMLSTELPPLPPPAPPSEKEEGEEEAPLPRSMGEWGRKVAGILALNHLPIGPNNRRKSRKISGMIPEEPQVARDSEHSSSAPSGGLMDLLRDPGAVFVLDVSFTMTQGGKMMHANKFMDVMLGKDSALQQSKVPFDVLTYHTSVHSWARGHTPPERRFFPAFVSQPTSTLTLKTMKLRRYPGSEFEGANEAEEGRDPLRETRQAGLYKQSLVSMNDVRAEHTRTCNNSPRHKKLAEKKSGGGGTRDWMLTVEQQLEHQQHQHHHEGTTLQLPDLDEEDRRRLEMKQHWEDRARARSHRVMPHEWMEPPESSSLEDARRWVYEWSLNANGSTRLTPALTAAMAARPQALFLLSDGLEQDIAQACALLHQLEVEGLTPAHLIIVGLECNPQGRRNLRTLGKAFGRRSPWDTKSRVRGGELGSADSSLFIIHKISRNTRDTFVPQAHAQITKFMMLWQEGMNIAALPPSEPPSKPTSRPPSARARKFSFSSRASSTHHSGSKAGSAQGSPKTSRPNTPKTPLSPSPFSKGGETSTGGEWGPEDEDEEAAGLRQQTSVEVKVPTTILQPWSTTPPESPAGTHRLIEGEGSYPEDPAVAGPLQESSSPFLTEVAGSKSPAGSRPGSGHQQRDVKDPPVDSIYHPKSLQFNQVAQGKKAIARWRAIWLHMQLNLDSFSPPQQQRLYLRTMQEWVGAFMKEVADIKEANRQTVEDARAMHLEEMSARRERNKVRVADAQAEHRRAVEEEEERTKDQHQKELEEWARSKERLLEEARRLRQELFDRARAYHREQVETLQNEHREILREVHESNNKKRDAHTQLMNQHKSKIFYAKQKIEEAQAVYFHHWAQVVCRNAVERAAVEDRYTQDMEDWERIVDDYNTAWDAWQQEKQHREQVLLDRIEEWRLEVIRLTDQAAQECEDLRAEITRQNEAAVVASHEAHAAAVQDAVARHAEEWVKWKAKVVAMLEKHIDYQYHANKFEHDYKQAVLDLEIQHEKDIEQWEKKCELTKLESKRYAARAREEHALACQAADQRKVERADVHEQNRVLWDQALADHARKVEETRMQNFKTTAALTAQFAQSFGQKLKLQQEELALHYGTYEAQVKALVDDNEATMKAALHKHRKEVEHTEEVNNKILADARAVHAVEVQAVLEYNEPRLADKNLEKTVHRRLKEITRLVERLKRYQTLLKTLGRKYNNDGMVEPWVLDKVMGALIQERKPEDMIPSSGGGGSPLSKSRMSQGDQGGMEDMMGYPEDMNPLELDFHIPSPRSRPRTSRPCLTSPPEAQAAPTPPVPASPPFMPSISEKDSQHQQPVPPSGPPLLPALQVEVSSPAGKEVGLPFVISQTEAYMVDIPLTVVNGVRPDAHEPCDVAVAFGDLHPSTSKNYMPENGPIQALFCPRTIQSAGTSRRLQLDEVNDEIDSHIEPQEVTVGLDRTWDTRTASSASPNRKMKKSESLPAMGPAPKSPKPKSAREGVSIALRKRVASSKQSMPLKPTYKYERPHSTFFQLSPGVPRVQVGTGSTPSEQLAMMEMLTKLEIEGKRDLRPERVSTHASAMAASWSQTI